MTRGPTASYADASNIEESLKGHDFQAFFIQKYQQEFGFVLQNRAIIVDDIRVRGTFSPISASGGNNSVVSSAQIQPHSTTMLYFDDSKKWLEVPVYLHTDMLGTKTVVQGPAIIMQNQATVVVESEWKSEILPTGDLYLSLKDPSSFDKDNSQSDITAKKIEMDPIQLSVFSHRFMGKKCFGHSCSVHT